jgi:hypothetical protein
MLVNQSKIGNMRKVTVIAVAAMVIIIPIVILLADFDGDGLSNFNELRAGTSMFNSDTDGDGLFDGLEINGWDITVNKISHHVSSNPLSIDSDGDGLNDWREHDNRVDPLFCDTDADNLTDAYELDNVGTLPFRSDTDGDGLSDGREVLESFTNPLLEDTDKDGSSDGMEVENMKQWGANPLHRDIFVEIDRMDENTRWMTAKEKEDLISVFENAPILNPDGTWGVKLHMFENEIVPSVDNLDGRSNWPSDLNRIGYSRDYEERYKSYGDGCYYALFAKHLSVGVGGHTTEYGFVIDTLPSLDIPNFDGVNAHSFMHEVGHCLGLTFFAFDGIDSGIYNFSEYPSVMNFNGFPTDNEGFIVWNYLGYSNGGAFNDWAYLNENGFVKYPGNIIIS